MATYTCAVCLEVFTSNDARRDHRLLAHPNGENRMAIIETTCPHCGIVIYGHDRIVPRGIRCDHCAELFPTEYSWNVHNHTEHRCSERNQLHEFTDRELQGVIATANEALNPATVDPFILADAMAGGQPMTLSEAVLDRPVRRERSLSPPFMFHCGTCGAGFANQLDRDACERGHQNAERVDRQSGSNRVYQCNVCSKWFRDPRSREVCQLSHRPMLDNQEQQKDNSEFTRKLSIRQPRKEGL
jgi:hypothetical protein